MIAVSICYYLIQYWAKQKHLLLYHDTSNLKDIDFKNILLTQINDVDFDNILLDQKSYKNILVHSISDKTSIGAKPLRIRFDKVYGFIRVDEGTRI